MSPVDFNLSMRIPGEQKFDREGLSLRCLETIDGGISHPPHVLSFPGLQGHVYIVNRLYV